MDENQTYLKKSDQQGKSLETEGKLKCYVIMPYGSKGEYSNGIDESDYVYNCIITPAIEKFKNEKHCDVEVVRHTNKDMSGMISSSILEDIVSSDFCIIDITGSNPSIFFELGIRYSLRNKTTILLGQPGSSIPFNIKGCRLLEYRCLKPWQAIEGLTDLLISGYQEKKTDSLIYETFPDMEVNIPNKVKSSGELCTIASWSDWLDRLKKLYLLLSNPYKSGTFVPNVIFGISNGGLIIADLLARELFSGIPVLSLWANRWILDVESVDGSCYYFDNEYNKSALNYLKSHMVKDKKTKILIVDDKLSTGQTIVQASTFIKKELKDNYEILFTPLYCKNREYAVIEQYLPYGFNDGKTFNITKIDYYKQVATNANEISLPYHGIFNQMKTI